MRMNAKQANLWRRDHVDKLVEAHKQDSGEAIEAAMMAVRIPGSSTTPASIGFSLNDLRYHAVRLIERADYLETVRMRKESAAHRVVKAAERREEKAERLESRAQRIGGTVPREEYAKARDLAKQARAEAEDVRKKVGDIEASVADLDRTIAALNGAAFSIKALVDVRTTPAMQAERTQGVLVASA